MNIEIANRLVNLRKNNQLSQETLAESADVHIKDRDGTEVHVGWDGIHVEDREDDDSVCVDQNEVDVKNRKYEHWWVYAGRIPFSLLMLLLFFIAGSVYGMWHPAWMLFLLIPVWESFLGAVKKRNPHVFAYPVLVTFLFLCMGFFMGAWHPGWVIFLTIPIYYTVMPFWKGDTEKE